MDLASYLDALKPEPQSGRRANRRKVKVWVSDKPLRRAQPKARPEEVSARQWKKLQKAMRRSPEKAGRG